MSGVVRINYPRQHARGYRAFLFDATGEGRKRRAAWPSRFFSGPRAAARARLWLLDARERLKSLGVTNYAEAMSRRDEVRAALKELP